LERLPGGSPLSRLGGLYRCEIHRDQRNSGHQHHDDGKALDDVHCAPGPCCGPNMPYFVPSAVVSSTNMPDFAEASLAWLYLIVTSAPDLMMFVFEAVANHSARSAGFKRPALHFAAGILYVDEEPGVRIFQTDLEDHSLTVDDRVVSYAAANE